jgi:hypothetical protein
VEGKGGGSVGGGVGLAQLWQQMLADVSQAPACVLMSRSQLAPSSKPNVAARAASSSTQMPGGVLGGFGGGDGGGGGEGEGGGGEGEGGGGEGGGGDGEGGSGDGGG